VVSAPFIDDPDKIRGAIHEIISAMSSLNMEAEELYGPFEHPAFLSQTDRWAKHAMVHMHAAIDYLRRAA
jgi:hypothetical protein